MAASQQPVRRRRRSRSISLISTTTSSRRSVRKRSCFSASTLAEDRSVLDLLSADYTFVNERLARHYGIPGIYGSRFRRVTLPNPQRGGGVLGHGGLLALTSYPTRTSPVLRGKWLLDTILVAPPPSPPADVPEFPPASSGGKPVSVRDRLEQHRKNPACASCHSSFDPLGFALDNFDVLGAWRTMDEAGGRVDASGTMPGGEKVEGLAGLRALLLREREQFSRTVTEKLLLMHSVARSITAIHRPCAGSFTTPHPRTTAGPRSSSASSRVHHS